MSAPALTLYGRGSSDNVQKVLWTLGEIGLDFEHVELGGAHGGLDDPSFRALNPHGRVPTLRDGEVVVWESMAIVRYLAARYAAGTLWPEDPGARAVADQWMTWCQAAPYAAGNKLFWLTVRTPAADQDKAAIAQTLAVLTSRLRLVETRLESCRYLAGDHLTMADIPLGAILFRYFKLPIKRARLPNIARWYEDLAQREAYRRAVMVSFEALRGRLAY